MEIKIYQINLHFFTYSKEKLTYNIRFDKYRRKKQFWIKLFTRMHACIKNLHQKISFLAVVIFFICVAYQNDIQFPYFVLSLLACFSSWFNNAEFYLVTLHSHAIHLFSMCSSKWAALSNLLNNLYLSKIKWQENVWRL